MANIDGLRDRYRGVLVGLAVGDSLGATVEFMSPSEIRDRYGVLRDIIGGGWLHLQPGEVTDDTQMALCIAHSIVALRQFDAADIAARFLDWYRSKPPDIGSTTRVALSMLDEGVPWQEAGARAHRRLSPRDAANGSIMRCAPVALYARADATANARYSADSSRITHANPVCIDSTIALNGAIAALLDDPSADALRIAMEATGNGDVRGALTEIPHLRFDQLDSGGFVLETLQSAFWALSNHESLEEAIVAAVNLGNDADTTGAVTGALAGARWGYSAIPDRWLQVLRTRDELITLADRLLELSAGLSADVTYPMIPPVRRIGLMGDREVD